METKARQTAELVAERLDAPPEVSEGLHEHERRNVPITSEEAYRAAAASLFQNPNDLVFGDETAAQAGERFQRAMNGLLETKEGNLIVVAHGTVITLYVVRRNELDPFELWSKLGLPSFVVLSRPGFRLLELVPDV
jgi:broad specificity phosphatase PhoE